MTHDDKIVEAVARAIEGEIDVVEMVSASPGTIRRLKASRIARAAITAYQAEVEKERAERLSTKAEREGFNHKIDWLRQYRALTGCPLKQALAAYDADEPLPNPPASP